MNWFREAEQYVVDFLIVFGSCPKKRCLLLLTICSLVTSFAIDFDRTRVRCPSLYGTCLIWSDCCFPPPPKVNTSFYQMDSNVKKQKHVMSLGKSTELHKTAALFHQAVRKSHTWLNIDKSASFRKCLSLSCCSWHVVNLLWVAQSSGVE